jgi:2',3'-cyclic-nucleotide 2'-phosphodiesterase (5'-nucleotidase family)
VSGEDQGKRLTILQINDTHGYLEPHRELIWKGRQPEFQVLGGFARIAALFRSLREEVGGAVLALDNGDTFHGTYAAVASKGEALLPLANALGLDAMTAHWEFAWGPKHFQALASRLAYPVLAINCYRTADGTRPFRASLVLERAGLRIGIIGIAATIIDKSMPQHFSEGLRFTNGDKELPGEIHRLRQDESVELVVVLSHLGFPQDCHLARTIGGIDVIVSGHTHNRLEEPALVNGTVIVQSGCHGSFVGRLDLRVADGAVEVERHRLIPVDASIEPDPAMQAMVDGTLAPHRTMLAEIVGHTEAGLHRNTILDAPMDDMLLAAIADAARTDIAVSNGWRYGAPIPPGPITMNDLWNIIPTNPPVSTVDLTGAEIWELLEENLERTFSADPFGQMGGYLKRFRGLTVQAKLENPPGHRIERVFKGRLALDPTETYTVAFVTEQGVPDKYGRNRRDLDIRAIEALRSYCEAQSRTKEEQAGRLIPV